MCIAHSSTKVILNNRRELRPSSVPLHIPVIVYVIRSSTVGGWLGEAVERVVGVKERG